MWCLAPRAVGCDEPKLGLPAGADHSTRWMAEVVLGAMIRTATGYDTAIFGPMDRSVVRSDRDPRSVGITR